MKTVRSAINRNIRMIFIIAAVTAVALGGLLLLISGNQERDQVPAAPSKATGETVETVKTTESTQAPQTSAEDSKLAQKLYAARTESISDSAAVATLLETIDLKKRVAVYMVNLHVKSEPRTVDIRFDRTVKEAEKDQFDRKIQAYAEQILALVSDAQQVQWTYKVKPQKGTAQEVTVFLNERQAGELLKNDIKLYGSSEKAVEALLRIQKGN